MPRVVLDVWAEDDQRDSIELFDHTDEQQHQHHADPAFTDAFFERHGIVADPRQEVIRKDGFGVLLR